MLVEFDKSIRAWSGKDFFPPGDSIQKAYAADRKELRKIYHLFKIGKYKEADEKVSHLDTIVRDQIPVDVYDFLEKHME